MIRSSTDNLSFKDMKLPLLFVLLAGAFIIPSIPGQGNNLTLAIGLVFAALAIYLARRTRNKNDP